MALLLPIVALVAFVSFEAANGLPYGPLNENNLDADVGQDEKIMKRFLEFDKNGDDRVSLQESKAGQLSLYLKVVNDRKNCGRSYGHNLRP